MSSKSSPCPSYSLLDLSEQQYILVSEQSEPWLTDDATLDMLLELKLIVFFVVSV